MNHLNLLKMTAIISKTKTVMMAMVITRFVAILKTPHISTHRFLLGTGRQKNVLPTSDPLQALYAAINIALALVQNPGGMIDRLALLLQLRQRAGSDRLGLIRQRLASFESLCAAVQPVRPYKYRQSLYPDNPSELNNE